MTDMPEGIAALIRAQGKYDVEEIAARAQAVLDSGVLDEPEVAEPRQTEIVVDEAAFIPHGSTPTVMPPDTLLDTPHARDSDPVESHVAAHDVEEREGSTGSVKKGTQKFLILSAYEQAERPLTDAEAWRAAGLDVRASGAWRRCSDLLAAGMIRRVSTKVDVETGKNVRTCAITLDGANTLKRARR